MYYTNTCRSTDCLSRVALAALAATAWMGVGPVLGQLSSTDVALPDEEVKATYSFERPEVAEVTIAGQVYDRVTMPGVPNCGNVGQPALPAIGAHLLLPMGAEVTGIEVIAVQRVLLGHDYFIEPISPPVRLMPGEPPAGTPTPDPAIYTSDRIFPASVFESSGTQSFRGYQILILKLSPVEYVPASGELYYYPEMTVVVSTADTGRVGSLYRGLSQDQAAVRTRIDNPEVVSSYRAAPAPARGFELLILTTDSLANSFQPLKSHHDANGIPTEIHTTTDVGGSNPDDIRDYIRDRYQYDGIQYVLIGADDDIIPAKDLYVQAYSGGPIEYNMPADIYYACLDGTYNYDGDSYWGEPTDGPGGGDVDLVAEVYVGRASVGNTTEASRFVNKTIWYLTGQHTQPEKALLVGEYLGFGGDSEYAANSLEELIDGCGNHGYTTVGIPSDAYIIDELFERDRYWTKSDLVSRINAGVHILNHLGHGDTNYAMKLYDSDIMSDLTNTDLCFVYSQTCLAGHFDGSDCWAEYMNIKTDHGGFAVIMNARYGWGLHNSTDGPSQRFNREFWDAIFGEGMPELSEANQDSKEDNIYRINEGCMRWCTYGLNLFGDPTVAVQGVTVAGMRVAPQTGFEAAGPVGGPFTPSSQDYTLENVGDYGINYEVTKSQDWLTITNGSGYLAPQQTAVVTVSINSNAESLPLGVYTDMVTLTNTTDHRGDTTRLVTLDVGGHIAYWSFDECEGSIAHDYSRYDNHGTLYNDVAWVPGVSGCGLEFDDLDDIVRFVPAGFDDPIDNTFTIAAWVFGYENDPHSYGFIFDARSQGANSGFTLTMNQDGGIRLRLLPSGDTIANSFPVCDGDWTHIAAMFDYTPGTLRLFINGQEDPNSPVEATAPYCDDYSDAAIGNNHWAPGDGQWRPFHGVLDELQIYKRALSADEIFELYSSLTPYDPLPGDLNCDGTVNSLDIDAFVLALTDPDAYAVQYPDCRWLNADCNHDCAVDGLDTDPFVELLTGG